MEERNYLASIDYSKSNERIITQYFCNSNNDDIFQTTDTLHFVGNNNDSIKIQRIGKTILTGNENWFYDEKTKTYYYYQFNKYCNDITGIYDKMMCTHFRWVQKNEKLNWGEFKGDVDNKIMFKFDKDDNNSNIEEFKKWLYEQYKKGFPVEVYYILQYPEISFLGNDYIPSPRFKVYHREIITQGSLKPKIEGTYYLNFEKAKK